MRLTFFSNFLNHHQLPLCQALQRALGTGFCFVATTPFNAGAVSAGYRDMNLDYDFCLPAYRSLADADAARRLGNESDVVLSGGVADSWYAPRLAENRLTFRVSERPLKPLYASLANPATAAALWWRNTRYRRRNLYLLACGAYTAGDFARVGAYKDKAFRWGYFPQVAPVLQRTPRNENAPMRLMWAGRMIDWKHPEHALVLVERLRQRGLPFTLKMVGEGPLAAELRARAAAWPEVEFTGALKAEQVHDEMAETDIYMFTSDENEGWGAVLNEAMAAGCAVLASVRAGAALWLVQDGENGLLYDGGEADLLHRGLHLAETPASWPQLGQAAYAGMQSLWNAECAAERLLALCQALREGVPLRYTEGPCSPA